MKITKEQLKNIVRETLQEESEYQKFFKKALEKAGKSIPQMSDEEKKAFFNKIEKTWKGRGTKSEGNAFGAAVAKAKKDGDDSFEVDGKKYKVEEESVNEANTIGKMAKRYKNKDKFISAFFAHMKKNYGDSFKDFEKDKKYRDNVAKIWDDEHGVKESINEGPSTEEKRIAMLAVRKQAKYRNVSLEQAIQDQINALEELKRDAKRGKLK